MKIPNFFITLAFVAATITLSTLHFSKAMEKNVIDNAAFILFQKKSNKDNYKPASIFFYENENMKALKEEVRIENKIILSRFLGYFSVEKREKHQKFALWSFGIEITIQHIKNLQNYNLTYEKLLKVLEEMKQLYTKTNHVKNFKKVCNENTIMGILEDEVVNKLIYEVAWWVNNPMTIILQYHIASIIEPLKALILWTDVGGLVIRGSSRNIIKKGIINVLKGILETEIYKYEELLCTRQTFMDEYSKL